jgi:hypothetical protein
VGSDTKKKSVFEEYWALRATLSPAYRADVDFSHGQGVAYVWGRQDAGESPKDTGESTEFGNAYGLHAARYAAQLISFRRNIRDAFERWRDGKPIED